MVTTRRESRGVARLETRARARVLQALYAWDLRGPAADVTRVATQLWDDLSVAPDERRWASALVEIVAASGATIDGELAGITAHWRLERLGAIERSVLRLGAAELSQGATPPRVVIHEAVRLAERYGSQTSAGFVNGILDALARQQGRL
jgi:N utilization substance protein B